jgi:hypothetical protein
MPDTPALKDFFINYTGADRAWAEWIGWELEAPPSEKLERFYRKLNGIFAEEYRDEVMRLTLEKKRERVTKRGPLLPGAWPLFGYTWNNEVKKKPLYHR